MDQVTMHDILKALERELGQEAFGVYEWYCSVYHVGAGDIAPASVRIEVLGK